MAIAVRGTPTNTNTSGTSATIVLTVPTGTVAGDVMVAIVSDWTGTGCTVTTPTGWTLLQPKVNETTNIGLSVFYKIAVASEPNVTITYSSAQGLAGGITSFSGVSNTTPLSGTPTNSTSAVSTTTPQPPNMTTADDNAMVIPCIAGFASGTSWTFTAPPSGFTEGTQANRAGNNRYNVEDSYALQATAGTTNIGTATASTTVLNMAYQTFALRATVVNLRAAPAGVGTPTANVAVRHPLAAVSAGKGATLNSLPVTHPLGAVSAGKGATGPPALPINHLMVVGAAGKGSSTARLAGPQLFIASGAGKGATTANLGIRYVMQAAAAGHGASTDVTGLVRVLQAASAGKGLSTANIQKILRLVAASGGHGVTSTTVLRLAPLIASASGRGSTRLSIRDATLLLHAAGFGTTTANLKVNHLMILSTRAKGTTAIHVAGGTPVTPLSTQPVVGAIPI